MAEAHARGNELYLAGDFAGAVRAYTDAIKAADCPSSSPGGRIALLPKAYANRAQAHLQLRDYEATLSDATSALAHDRTAVKALIRRATAALALEKLDVAQADLKAALALAPGPSLVRTINALREQARQMEVLLKGPSGRDADQQDAVGLVQEQQTLRLFLKEHPPRCVRLGEWVPLSLYLANEFGLWRRSDFPSEAQALPLLLTVLERVEGRLEESPSLCLELEGGDPSLHRGSSCRAELRVRFVEQQQHQQCGDSGEALLARRVHVCVSLGGPLTRAVMPIFSLPLAVCGAAAGADAPTPQGVGEGEGDGIVTSCRGFDVPAIPAKVLVAEAPGQLGLGGKVWDAALVLLDFLSSRPELVARPRRCVELGAGTGLVGVACALMGADVTITDLEPVVPLIAANITLNPASSRGGRAVAAAHCWGSPVDASLRAPFDSILMADVVYDPAGYSPLVASLLALSHPGTAVIMAHRDRHPDNRLFFEEASRHFVIRELGFRRGEAGRAQGGVCADVRILEMVPLGAGAVRQ